MTHTQDLLPCPFCGGAAMKRRESLDERFAYADQVSIRCRACGIEVSRMGDTSKGGYADNSGVDAAAIAAWNRRAPAPAVPDYVAGLVKRARRTLLYEGSGECSSLADDLADALEAQAAELALLRAEISAIQHPQSGGSWYKEADIDRLQSRADQAEAENARLREVLAGLEGACEQLASTRTHEVYLAMIDSGQANDLLALDARRKAARTALQLKGDA